MGRHGGGSSGGGRSSGGRSGGGSRSGGRSSGVKTSDRPFRGAYRRSYYRRGRYYHFYTNNPNYGTKSGWNFGTIVILLFITFHMIAMCSGMLLSSIDFGSKVNGDRNFIRIEDNIDILTYEEEDEVLELFQKIYDKSGMPVMLYTDNFDYQDYYYSIENYSEDLYYNRTMAEDSMIILFTCEEVDNGAGIKNEWKYDFYCGDDTMDCLSDAEFDKLLDNFQKMMYRDDLVEALDYSWNSIMDDLAETELSFALLPIVLFLVFFYGMFYVAILSGVFKQNAVYKYYKEHPEELSMQRCTGDEEIYPEPFFEITCPNCGARITSDNKTCRYCGTNL